MKFRVGDIVRLKKLKNDWRPPSTFKMLATVTDFEIHEAGVLAELTFFDGYCDTYWTEHIVLASKNNDPNSILQPENR